LHNTSPYEELFIILASTGNLDCYGLVNNKHAYGIHGNIRGIRVKFFEGNCIVLIFGIQENNSIPLISSRGNQGFTINIS
jgi:hypothetical protein